MAAPVIDRLTLTDDDGSGLTGTPLNNALFQDLQNKIDALAATIYSQLTSELGLRPGDIVIMSGPLRAGYLEADGAAISRSTYAALNAAYAAVGYPYGTGNGTTTFNVPDLRGRVPVGIGTGVGLTTRAPGDKVGVEAVALAVGDLPAHNHAFTDPGHTHTINDPPHGHPVSDPTHAHGVTDPLHAHGVTDPGHDHQYGMFDGGGIGSDYPPGGGAGAVRALRTSREGTGLKVNEAASGVSVNGAATGIGIVPSGTGITINGGPTGITIQSVGGNAAHANMQPSLGVRFGVKT